MPTGQRQLFMVATKRVGNGGENEIDPIVRIVPLELVSGPEDVGIVAAAGAAVDIGTRTAIVYVAARSAVQHILAGRALGVLVVQNRASRTYREDEVEALETTAMVIAEMVATGISHGWGGVGRRGRRAPWMALYEARSSSFCRPPPVHTAPPSH